MTVPLGGAEILHLTHDGEAVMNGAPGWMTDFLWMNLRDGSWTIDFIGGEAEARTGNRGSFDSLRSLWMTVFLDSSG
jgi:hypothetical protein